MMGQKQSNKSSPARSQQRNHFDELLACQICYCKAVHPTLCPHCSKLYCENCIVKSLKFKPECPNCRQMIKGQMTNCSRFLNELALIVSSLIEHEEQIQKCKEHGISLNYFCEDCNRSACCECKMFGEHQSHSFKAIKLIYEEKYNRIRDLLSGLKSKIIEKEEILTEIQNNLIEVKKRTEAQIIEIDEFTEKYRQKVIMETEDQNDSQFEAAQALSKQMRQLQQLKNELATSSEQANKTHCYKTDLQLMNKIEQSLLKSKEILTINKRVASIEEATPPFKKFSLVIHPFSVKKQSKQSIYSDLVEYQGSFWRLLVYFESKVVSYISVYLQLMSNPDDINQYEYLVELVNPYDHSKNLVKEHQAVFQIKESLGYSKLIRTQQLEGFIDKERDSFEIVFGVRMCYYCDLYRRRKVMLKKLQDEIQLQDIKIQNLESELYRQSVTSITLQEGRDQCKE